MQELYTVKISLGILHDDFNEALKFDAFRVAGETYRVTIIRSVDEPTGYNGKQSQTTKICCFQG